MELVTSASPSGKAMNMYHSIRLGCELMDGFLWYFDVTLAPWCLVGFVSPSEFSVCCSFQL